MQVTLLSEGKTFLTSKFLSLSEDVKVGSKLALPKYLVEVGEPLMSSEGIIGSLELGFYLTFFISIALEFSSILGFDFSSWNLFHL